MALIFADVSLDGPRIAGRRSFDGGVTWERFDMTVDDAWILTAFGFDQTVATDLWRHQDALEGVSAKDAEWDHRILLDSSPAAKAAMLDIATTRLPATALADEWGVDVERVIELDPPQLQRSEDANRQ